MSLQQQQHGCPDEARKKIAQQQQGLRPQASGEIPAPHGWRLPSRPYGGSMPVKAPVPRPQPGQQPTPSKH